MGKVQCKRSDIERQRLAVDIRRSLRTRYLQFELGIHRQLALNNNQVEQAAPCCRPLQAILSKPRNRRVRRDRNPQH